VSPLVRVGVRMHTCKGASAARACRGQERLVVAAELLLSQETTAYSPSGRGAGVPLAKRRDRWHVMRGCVSVGESLQRTRLRTRSRETGAFLRWPVDGLNPTGSGPDVSTHSTRCAYSQYRSD
jgi:hypothetical protein